MTTAEHNKILRRGMDQHGRHGGGVLQRVLVDEGRG